MNIDKDIEIGIAVDTEELDDALEKSEELAELANNMSPQVTIRNCRGCTFNIYTETAVKNGRA